MHVGRDVKTIRRGGKATFATLATVFPGGSSFASKNGRFDVLEFVVVCVVGFHHLCRHLDDIFLQVQIVIQTAVADEKRSEGFACADEDAY